MKNILHYVSSMNRGGEETFIMNIFRNIDRRKVNFGFLYTAKTIGAYGPEISKLGGKYYHVQLDKNNLKGLKQISNYFILKRKLKSLANQYDYFHVHTQHAMDAYLSALAAYRAGFKRVIIHSHNASTLYHKRAHYFFRKTLLHKSKVIRFACGYEAGEWMFGKDDFTVIHNGVDLSKFRFNLEKRKEIRNRLNWSGKHIIANVGRFDIQKNHLFLIKSFYEYSKMDKKAVLVLIGTGELEKKIKEEVYKLNISDRVQFLGARSDVNELYQGIDLFVLPSLFEGLPVVLIEAQAADLPCIISDNITNEVDILSTTHRLPLKLGEKKWALEYKKFFEHIPRRIDTTKELSKAGYVSSDIALKLQNFYLNNME